MLKRQSKHLALLLVLTMLATLFVGVGVAQAKSINDVSKVVSIDSDYDDDTGVVLTIKEDTDFPKHFVKGDTFRLKLTDGVKWNTGSNFNTSLAEGVVNDAKTALDVTFKTVYDTVDILEIPLWVKVDGAEGNVAVIIDPMDSGVTGGEKTFAKVSDGKMTATVDKVKKIAKNSSNTAGVIEVRENTIGAASGTVNVKVKLPANFEWTDASVDMKGGFSSLGKITPSLNGRTLEFSFTAPSPRTQRGYFDISSEVKPGRDAKLGEIEVSIAIEQASKSLLDTDLVIAEYVDWGIKAKVAEVKELLSGKFDQKTAKITIEETVPGTLLKNRDLTLELPSWVKITGVENWKSTTLADKPNPNGKNKYIDIGIETPTTETSGKLEFTLLLSIEGTQSGDIEAKIFGAGVDETSLLIAKAVAPITAEIDKVNEVKIGVQSQPLADLTITEAKKNSIRQVYKENSSVRGSVYEGNDGAIFLALTEGAAFAADPVVEVTDGNIEIKKNDVKRASASGWFYGGVGFNDNSSMVIIPIKSEGTKPSTLKVSNLKITVNRSVPEGDLLLKVGGPAVIENSRYADSNWSIDPGEFDASSIDIVGAKVITPADANIHAVSTYVIGNTIYQINGVDQAAMDQAPYIKNDRTFLPIRFVAYGLGIGDNGIIWDQVNQTVTLMKNDKVVQLKIGSTTMLVNGASITMDAAPEITAANRTCLPIRFVAEAFGAVVGWDAATQTVTVTL